MPVASVSLFLFTKEPQLWAGKPGVAGGKRIIDKH